MGTWVWKNAIIVTRKQITLLFFQFAVVFIATWQTSTEQNPTKINSMCVFCCLDFDFFSWWDEILKKKVAWIALIQSGFILVKLRNSPVSIQDGGWTDHKQLCWEGLGGARGWEVGHEPPMFTCSPGNQFCPEFYFRPLMWIFSGETISVIWS